MTIEALLTSIDNRLAVLATLLSNQDGETATAVAPAAAAAPARRGRGRPAHDDPKTVAPVTVAPVATVAPVVAKDPFDDEPAPAPVVVPAKKLEKSDVRAALEGYRLRLKTANLALGDDDATATNKATTRALAVLKEVSGETTLAGAEQWTQELMAKTIDGVSKAK